MLELVFSDLLVSLGTIMRLSLAETLSRMHVFHLVESIRILITLFTRQTWLLAGWACAARAWWAEVHDDSGWKLFLHLVSSTSMNYALMWSIVLIHGPISPVPVQIFTSADSCSIDDLSFRSVMDLIAKLETFAIVVFATSVPMDLVRLRWPLVCHWDVVLAIDTCSNGRHIIHVCVGVRIADL